MKRRRFLAVAAGAVVAVPASAQRQMERTQDVRPLVEKLTRGNAPREGGIDVELPAIAENGNAVPLRVRVESAMSPEDHVAAIHVIADRNPRPLVASFHLGPASGRAEVNTRIRLAGSQRLTVLAELSGGRFLRVQQDVLVTSAACLDESL